MHRFVIFEKEVEKHSINTLPDDLLLEAKMKGYADRQIAHLVRCLESEIYNKRNDLGIKRVYKLVDTCASEFTAKTPYYYSTFEMSQERNGEKFTDNESKSSDIFFMY